MQTNAYDSRQTSRNQTGAPGNVNNTGCCGRNEKINKLGNRSGSVNKHGDCMAGQSTKGAAAGSKWAEQHSGGNKRGWRETRRVAAEKVDTGMERANQGIFRVF